MFFLFLRWLYTHLNYDEEINLLLILFSFFAGKLKLIQPTKLQKRLHNDDGDVIKVTVVKQSSVDTFKIPNQTRTTYYIPNPKTIDELI